MDRAELEREINEAFAAKKAALENERREALRAVDRIFQGLDGTSSLPTPASRRVYVLGVGDAVRRLAFQLIQFSARDIFELLPSEMRESYERQGTPGREVVKRIRNCLQHMASRGEIEKISSGSSGRNGAAARYQTAQRREPFSITEAS